MRHLGITAPDQLHSRLKGLTVAALVAETTRWEPQRIHGTVPICLAGGVGPNGSDRGHDAGVSMGVVGPLAVHW